MAAWLRCPWLRVPGGRWLGLIAGLVGALLAAHGAASAADIPNWENPLVFGRNKLPARNAAWR